MKNYIFPIILLSSIVIGSITGIFMGEDATKLKPLGDIFINMMFVIVVPLVFFTISSSIANMNSPKRIGKIMSNMGGTFLLTGIIASIFMLGVTKLFPAHEGVKLDLVKPENSETISLADQIVKTITVPDFVDLFSRSNMLALIIFAVLIGFSAHLSGENGKLFSKFLKSTSEVLVKFVGIVMYYAPIGLGAYFASLVGEYGPTLLGSYFKAAIIYFIAAVIYGIVAFSLYAFIAGKRKGVKLFWKNAIEPTATAFGTCSSSACIPVNMKACKNIGIKDDIVETTIPLGSALHKDGSVMGGVLKMTFLMGIFGVPSNGISTVLIIIGMSLLIGMVMGAIPGGGMIAEMLILTLFGFPIEALPILAAISAIIDPPATWLNATGDNAAAMLVSRGVEGKDWLEKDENLLNEKKDSIDEIKAA